MDNPASGLIDLLSCLTSATDAQLELGTSQPRHLLCKFIADYESKACVVDVDHLDVSHIFSIVKLLQRLTVLDPSILLLYLKLLKILSRGSTFRSLAGKECIVNLVPCLRGAANTRVSAEGVNVLLNLCFDKENVLTLLDNDGAKLLLRFLQEPDNSLLFNATGAIQSVCFHRQGRKQLFRLGCIPSLLHLLDTDQNNILERAVAAIHNLSADSEAIKCLRQHHAIPKLVALLDCPRLRTAASAAGALQNMSREVASRLAVLELHATGPLTNLLSSTEPQAQVCAAGALLNIMGPDLDRPDATDSSRQATLRVVSLLLSTSMIYHALFQERPPLDILDLEAIQRPPSAMSTTSMSPERSRVSMDGMYVPASSPPSSRRWSGRSLTRDLMERPRSCRSELGSSGVSAHVSGTMRRMSGGRPHSAAHCLGCVPSAEDNSRNCSSGVSESLDLKGPGSRLVGLGGIVRESLKLQQPGSGVIGGHVDRKLQGGAAGRSSWPAQAQHSHTRAGQQSRGPARAAINTNAAGEVDHERGVGSSSIHRPHNGDTRSDVHGSGPAYGVDGSGTAYGVDGSGTAYCTTEAVGFDCDIAVADQSSFLSAADQSSFLSAADQSSFLSAAEVSALLRSGGVQRRDKTLDTTSRQHTDCFSTHDNPDHDHVLPGTHTSVLPNRNSHVPPSRHANVPPSGNMHVPPSGNTHVPRGDNTHIPPGGKPHMLLNLQQLGMVHNLDERFQTRLESWGSEATSWDMADDGGLEDMWAQLSTRSGGSGRLVPWCSSSKPAADKPPIPGLRLHPRIYQAWTASPPAGSPTQPLPKQRLHEERSVHQGAAVAPGMSSRLDTGPPSGRKEASRKVRESKIRLTTQLSQTREEADTRPAGDRDGNGTADTCPVSKLDAIHEASQCMSPQGHGPCKSPWHARGRKVGTNHPGSSQWVTSVVNESALSSTSSLQSWTDSPTRIDARSRLNRSCDGSLGLQDHE